MSENDVQAIETASAEAQEVLKELEAEGFEIEGKQVEPKVEPVTETTVEPEPVKPSDESPAERPKREPKFVPVGIHTEERHKRQEAEARAEKAIAEAEELRKQLGTQKPNDDSEINTLAESVAQESGVDVDFVKKILKASGQINSRKAELPDDVKADLASIRETKIKLEQEQRELQQETGFNNEFSEVIKEFPNLSNSKEELKQLAFTAQNSTIPLKLLALQYLHENPQGRKTAEAPIKIGKADSKDVIDFAEITEEQFANLSFDQMDEYEKWRKKNNIG
jgi:hypothetical protein